MYIEISKRQKMIKYLSIRNITIEFKNWELFSWIPNIQSNFVLGFGVWYLAKIQIKCIPILQSTC